MKNYLLSGMYTTRKNIKTNEQNYNSNDKTNDSPRWGEKSILTSLINIEGTSVVIDGKDFDNLSFTQRYYVEMPRNPTTIEEILESDDLFIDLD